MQKYNLKLGCTYADRLDIFPYTEINLFGSNQTAENYNLHGKKYIISTQKRKSTDPTATTNKSMARNIFCNSVRNTFHMLVIRFLGQKTDSKTTNQLSFT